MERRDFIVVSIVVLILLISSCRWFQYKTALKDQANEWYEKEYVGKHFSGKIKAINKQNDNPNKVVINIDDSSEFDINYGVTCVDIAFNEFVAEGDSVFKKSGSKYIKFCKPDNQCKEIELNFCDKFK